MTRGGTGELPVWAGVALRGVASIVVFAVAFALLWQGAVWALAMPPYLMPTPLDAAGALVGQGDKILANALFTLAEAGVGLIVAAALAVVLGGLFVASPAAHRLAFPWAVALRSVPVVAIAPIVTLMVGRGFWAGVTVVVLAAFFPILVNCMRGYVSLPRGALEMMHVLDARPAEVLWYVRLPYAVGFVFSGLRTAAPIAILGAMLSEWLTGNRGLGYLILDSAALRELDLLWAAIVVSMLLGLLIFWTTATLEGALRRV
ncbi:MAG: ABC transporter permease [Azospirillaceae bacterium]